MSDIFMSVARQAIYEMGQKKRGKLHGNEILDPDNKCDHDYYRLSVPILMWDEPEPLVCPKCLKVLYTSLDTMLKLREEGKCHSSETEKDTRIRKKNEKKLRDAGYRLIGNSGLWECCDDYPDTTAKINERRKRKK